MATGEHLPNRVVFKQFLKSGAMDFCQLDSCRLGGLNEIIPIILMAAKYEGRPILISYYLIEQNVSFVSLFSLLAVYSLGNEIGYSDTGIC